MVWRKGEGVGAGARHDPASMQVYFEARPDSGRADTFTARRAPVNPRHQIPLSAN